MEESPGILRVLLVAEPRRCPARALAELAAAVEGRCARVTVVGLAERTHPLAWWACGSGLVDLEELRAEALAEACRSARELIARLPGSVPAAHCAVPGRRDVRRLAAEHDAVVVAGARRSWARALRRGRAGGRAAAAATPPLPASS